MPLVSKFFRAQVFLYLFAVVSSGDNPQQPHHRRHRHHRRHSNSSTMVVPGQSAGRENVSTTSKSGTRHAHAATASAANVDVVNAEIVSFPAVSKEHIMHKSRDADKGIKKEVQGVAEATGCRAADVVLLGAVPVPGAQGPVEEVMFRSSSDVVAEVEDQAANPDSRLANGVLHTFLVARDGPEANEATEEEGADSQAEPQAQPQAAAAPEVDMAMPYGDLEPFGREDTAQELTESSIRESNAMVDQLERAEVAEEKRAVFRALTRLRGAAITSYDGIARSQTGNIDDYARKNQWRMEHPVHHLADEEADVHKWAFPDSDGDES